MKRLLVLLGLAPLVWITAAQAQRMSDEEVRSRIVNDYVGGFRAGDCPCPYSYAWNGQQCADKSLYNQRTGRRDIFCYPNDVSRRDIEEYRRYHEYRR